MPTAYYTYSVVVVSCNSLKLSDHCHYNLFQILYSSPDGICVHILGVLYAVQRIQQCCIHEIAFSGFPEASRRPVHCKYIDEVYTNHIQI
jgi:hypothetical protein